MTTSRSDVLSLEGVVDHSSRLIAVPSEKLECEAVELREIQCKDDKYRVHNFYTYRKNDSIFPEGWFILATGTDVNSEKIWNKYPDSHTIYLFLCEKL